MPPGAAGTVKFSTAPSDNDVVSDPVTSRMVFEGGPPANVFFQASANIDPSTSPVKLVGGDGGTGTPT